MTYIYRNGVEYMQKTITWEQREPHPEDDSEDIRKVLYTSPAHGAARLL